MWEESYLARWKLFGRSKSKEEAIKEIDIPIQEPEEVDKPKEEVTEDKEAAEEVTEEVIEKLLAEGILYSPREGKIRHSQS